MIPLKLDPSPSKEVAVIIPEVSILPSVPIPAVIPVSCEPSPLNEDAVMMPDAATEVNVAAVPGPATPLIPV